MRRIHSRAFLIVFILALPVGVQAAGPLIVNGNGTPLVWTTDPIPFNPDQGTLGSLSNVDAVAAVTANFDVWTAVPTASVSFTNAGALPVDVTSENWPTYLNVCDGLSAIIFDTDGSITDDVFGAGASNSILGFAGPECVTFVPAVIIEGVAVLNGKWIDGAPPTELPLSEFNGVFVHEFGHYVNLDHSQINLVEAFDGNPSDDDAMATMFPFIVDGDEMTSPSLDDTVSVSTLYPDPSFATDFGTITGTIYRSDGSTQFQGAYVIARETSDPRHTAVGIASGARYFPGNPGGPPSPALRGAYEIPGLPPGDYTVEIEEINPAFTGGSSVGPLDTPASLPGPPELYNGANEAAEEPPDDPSAFTTIAVAAASTTGGTDVIINVPKICDTAPLAGCRKPVLPQKAMVKIRNKTSDTGDGLTWKWLHGAATSKPEFGIPDLVTDYALCVYDEVGGIPTLKLALEIPSGGSCHGKPCWTSKSSGFTYKDSDLTPDGIQKLTLGAGVAGRAKITLKAKGANLGLPALPLAQTSKVIVQLKNEDGECWDADYSAAALKNDALQFRDKSD